MSAEPMSSTPATVLATVQVGGLTPDQLIAELKSHDVGLNESAEYLLTRPEMATPAQELTLVTATPSSLGLPSGSTLLDVLDAATSRGLALCPLATAAYLRLVWEEPESTDPALRRHRPPQGSLHVASAVLDPAYEVPKGFYLRTVEGRRWLRGYRSDVGYEVPPDTTYVFVRPS